MSIESEIFDAYQVNIEKCIAFGFKEIDGKYVYETYFLNDTFQAIITIDKIITGSVIEVELEEEYHNIRIDSFKGEFVAKVKEAYIEILKSIRLNCFESSKQANRVRSYIQSKYGIILDHPFEDKRISVFRCIKNQKWFGIMMPLSGKRYNKENEIILLNIKLEPEHVLSRLQDDGFYVAYHMDKKNWVSIVLDDTVSDSILFSCIDESYSLVNRKQYWIVPANPKYYDVFSHFETQDVIDWKQTSNVNVDDIVYIYITKPYACIMYKCVVVETDIPYSYSDENLSMKKIMRCKLLKKYNPGIDMEILNSYGIPNIRCIRKVSKKVIELFDY